ncbi:MAG TPA: Sec-dependent nitrous-oxide reductase [Candidatus Sphingobacterium stercoripullorum]|uniref:Sec-dependent nitrous-oxide reductase n=1 Tax=Candidatus Sphingobacterium stercoripullorum TaxID=2838759 RepID=A0A9D1WA49_9SPHI|nr:Sec-dependent nitrous-oxide reductase [Candidatus Sphingobacterium stercoripullorum]HLR51123.1 Sec-dependent nitrous-oxide reductase [Candidatus Sphingobacterium stercoripullorum]
MVHSLKKWTGLMAGLALLASYTSCKPKTAGSAVSGDAAQRVYVAPGQHDEFYSFTSGGFSGQMPIYGIPSGRLLKVIPVFSVDPENGYGFSEETKPMLNTSHGFVPWGDFHHLQVSQTNGESDGRWVFANENNTPRVARIDLTTFKTTEIIEIPNSAGNHSSPFITENTEYVVAGTRFSVPFDEENGDVPIAEYGEKFSGAISFISVDPESGKMDISFQLKTPPVNYDLSHSGKGPSSGWFFFSTYNTEKAHTLLEVNASQRDKDFIMAVNWKKAEEYVKAGKGKKYKTEYVHNLYDENTHTATSETKNEVLVLDPNEFGDLVYYIPCPKSPHGADVDPTGRYIVGSGKLASLIPVFAFDKIQKAIEEKNFEGEFDGIPVLNYDAVLHGEVQKPGLGPLHTEFDNEGNAYTSFFVSSEVVKWDLESLEIIDRQPTYYSTGHLTVAGGDTQKPFGKYLVAWNKITKDRYLPTGPELSQSAQLFDISGEKMQLLLDFPTIGEPHYAQIVPADLIAPKTKRFYDIKENNHPYVTKGEDQTKIVREGNKVHVYATLIRTHITPDNIEGIEVGDEVYFHVTNLEQDWDLPHGFAIKGNNNAELLVMPGETQTLKWIPQKSGIVPFYCSDFCSALHQEMQGYIRVSPKGSNVPLRYGTGDSAPGAEVN